MTPPFYIVKAEDAEYLPAKISGFTCSALSILGLTVAQRHGPLVPTGHSYGRPVLPKCALVAASEKDGLDPPGALLGPLSATHVRAFFS